MNPNEVEDPLACQITPMDVIAQMREQLSLQSYQIAQLLAAQKATEAQARKVLGERDAEIQVLKCGQRAVAEAEAVVADGS